MIAAQLRSRPFRADVAIVLVAGILLNGLAVVTLSGRAERQHLATAFDPVRTSVPAPAPALPTTPPPVVEPTVLAQITPDAARASNAAMPFASGPIAPARPFTFTGPAADRSIAQTCLAAAVLYEAGDDPEGERAVAQVVLNRVRHPAFPKTVCGVIFQGADHKSGCQFTFACDGAIDRPPNPAAWTRARAIADAALSGSVFKPVGTATHYHTDWVVPYWRDTFDKVAVVHTQIFYRWPGAWGSPRAFVGIAQLPEQLDPRLSALAGPVPLSVDPTALGDTPAAAPPSVDGVPETALKGNIVRVKDEARAQYILQLDPKIAGTYAVTGYTICADKPDCVVMGWTSAAEMPRALPVVTAQMHGLAFMYRKMAGIDMPLMQWNCRQTPRPNPVQCLPGTGPTAAGPPPR
jgi:spore germination cell wall hydrolase CwlJ-like protein